MTNSDKVQVELYQTPDGKTPFSIWFNSLRDKQAIAKIRLRLDRLHAGNFGDCKSIGEGVHELRIVHGPGYRLYFGQIGLKLVLLLCGGDKGSQQEDIRKAKKYWQDYKQR